MERPARATTFCLTHQLPEEQTSLVGLVCSQCKHRLDTRPPQGRCRSFWESQPAAYGLDGQPCFVYTLWWDDFRIRSLHPPESHVDPRAEIVPMANAREAAAAETETSGFTWLDDIRLERGLINDLESGSDDE